MQKSFLIGKTITYLYRNSVIKEQQQMRSIQVQHVQHTTVLLRNDKNAYGKYFDVKKTKTHIHIPQVN